MGIEEKSNNYSMWLLAIHVMRTFWINSCKKFSGGQIIFSYHRRLHREEII